MQHFIDKIRQALAAKTAEALEQFEQVRQAVEQTFADAERLVREQFARAERDLEVAAMAAADRFQQTVDSCRDDAVARAAGVALDTAEQVSASDPRPQKPTQAQPQKQPATVAAQVVEQNRVGVIPEPKKHAGNGRVKT